MDPQVTSAIGVLLNMGFGGVMLWLIFFKIMPEAKQERETSRAEFLAALRERDTAQAVQNQKSQLFIRAAMMIMGDKCPAAATLCPFKIHELSEEHT